MNYIYANHCKIPSQVTNMSVRFFGPKRNLCLVVETRLGMCVCFTGVFFITTLEIHLNVCFVVSFYTTFRNCYKSHERLTWYHTCRYRRLFDKNGENKCKYAIPSVRRNSTLILRKMLDNLLIKISHLLA
jgi:hypothetical protein